MTTQAMSMKTLFAIVIGLLVLTVGDAHAATRRQAVIALDQGNYVEAMADFTPLAEQGDPVAQLYLGRMYFLGQGIPQDYVQAMYWYRKSAELGNDKAQCNLGLMFERGFGVPQNYQQAFAWFSKAAAAGSAEAENSLGALYAHGLGVTQDFGQALALYKSAAAQGNVEALLNLGLMHEKGQLVQKDPVMAFALFNLAVILDSANKNQDARPFRARVMGVLSPEQIKSGEALTAQMQQVGVLNVPGVQ